MLGCPTQVLSRQERTFCESLRASHCLLKRSFCTKHSEFAVRSCSLGDNVATDTLVLQRGLLLAGTVSVQHTFALQLTVTDLDGGKLLHDIINWMQGEMYFVSGREYRDHTV